MHVYTFMVSMDGIATCLFLFVPLAANSSVCYWVNVDVIFMCIDIL